MTASAPPPPDDRDDDDDLPGPGGRRSGASSHPPLEADTVIAVEAPPEVRAQAGSPASRGTTILIVLLLLLWLLRLGAVPLIDVDEGAFSEATREMLANHDFGHTTLNGAPRFDKPILVYWLQAASATVFGLNEFAMRLPSALCGFGWCLSIAAFAWRRFGAAVAIAAAGILATSLGPMLIGRAATADSLLNFLLTLATLDIWRHLENGEDKPRRRAFAWIGLGLLAKGPVAFVIPAAAAGLWLLVGRDRSRLVRLVADRRAWAWMIGIAAPWYLYELWRDGMAFVEGFIVKHNLDRYSGSLEGHGGSLFYYVGLLPLLMWPWTPLLWPMLRRGRDRWNEPLGRFLLGWFLFVIVFFSLSGTKLPHYVLYGFTPLVLLAAMELAAVTRAVRAGLAATMLGLVAFGALSPWVAPLLARTTHDGLYRTLLSHAPVAPWVTAALPVALLVFAAVIWVPNVRSYLTEAEGALAGGVVTALFLVLAVLPWWGETLQAPIKQLAQTVPVAQLSLLDFKPLVQWKLHQPSIGFYLGKVVPRLEGDEAPPAGDWALTRTDRLTDADRRQFEIVREVRGYAIVRPATAASEPLSTLGAPAFQAEQARAAASAAEAASAARAAREAEAARRLAERRRHPRGR